MRNMKPSRKSFMSYFRRNGKKMRKRRKKSRNDKLCNIEDYLETSNLFSMQYTILDLVIPQ